MEANSVPDHLRQQIIEQTLFRPKPALTRESEGVEPVREATGSKAEKLAQQFCSVRARLAAGAGGVNESRGAWDSVSPADRQLLTQVFGELLQSGAWGSAPASAGPGQNKSLGDLLRESLEDHESVSSGVDENLEHLRNLVNGGDTKIVSL